MNAATSAREIAEQTGAPLGDVLTEARYVTSTLDHPAAALHGADQDAADVPLPAPLADLISRGVRARTFALDPLPACPEWCGLDAGHEFDCVGPDGTVFGFHEGRLAALTDDQDAPVAVNLVQRVARDQDGTVTAERPFVTIVTEDGGAEYSDPSALGVLVDALRYAAGLIDTIG